MYKLIILPILFFNLLPLGQILVFGSGITNEAILTIVFSLLIVAISLLKNGENKGYVPYGLIIVVLFLSTDAIISYAGSGKYPSLNIVLLFTSSALAVYIYKYPFNIGKASEHFLTTICLLYLCEFSLRILVGESIYNFPGGTPLFHVERIATKMDERFVIVESFLLSPAYMNLRSLPFVPGDYLAAGLSGEPHLSCLSIFCLYLLSDKTSKFNTINQITCVLALYFFSSVSVLIGLLIYIVYWILNRQKFALSYIVKSASILAISLTLYFLRNPIYNMLEEKGESRSAMETSLSYDAILDGIKNTDLGGSIFNLPNFYNGFSAPPISFVIAVLFFVLLLWIAKSFLDTHKYMSDLEKMFLIVVIAVSFKVPYIILQFPVVIFALEYKRFGALMANRVNKVRTSDARIKRVGVVG